MSLTDDYNRRALLTIASGGPTWRSRFARCASTASPQWRGVYSQAAALQSTTSAHGCAVEPRRRPADVDDGRGSRQEAKRRPVAQPGGAAKATPERTYTPPVKHSHPHSHPQLRRHIKQYPPRPCSLPWEKPDGALVAHNILFRWGNGGHIKADNYNVTYWKPALVVAGVIPPPAKGKRGRKVYATTRREGTHQLRHYFASVMLADGVSIRELAEYLGHADPGFTLRVYSHMLPDSHDRARQAISRRMFRPRLVGTEQGRNEAPGPSSGGAPEANAR